MEGHGHLERRASQDTLASLRQLDPSPMETPSPSTAEKRDPLDVETSSGTISSRGFGRSTSATGLSGSSHGGVYYLSRIQKYSSYAFGVFASLHLANTSLIPLVTRSVPGSETYLLMTREIYQTTITEPLLIGLPVLAHIGSGLALRLMRRSQNLKRYGASELEVQARRSAGITIWPTLSYISMSGYTFALAYSAHVFMNRVLPLVVDGDSSNVGLGYVAHGFARHPAVSWIAYAGLLTIGCGHMVWGAARWLDMAPSTKVWTASNGGMDNKTRKTRRRKWLIVQGVSLAVTAVWAAGGLGMVARAGPTEGWLGRLYDDLFAKINL